VCQYGYHEQYAEESQPVRRTFFRILSLVFMIAAVVVFSYPYWTRWYSGSMQAVVMQEYLDTTEAITPEMREEIFAEALAYNQLMASGIKGDEHGLYFDPFTFGSGQAPVGYFDQLKVADDNELMGVIEIPLLRLKLPIYHGVDEHTLQIGIGHVPQSALPVGGEGTHCVLSGHRGLRGMQLFTDIDRLKRGDVFLLHVLDHTLAYEVDEIHIVLPEEIELLAPIEGEDLVTLSTCTPLGINSHRLLVRGHRVPYVPFPTVWPDANTNQLLIALAITSVGLIYSIVFFILERRRLKRKRLAAPEGTELLTVSEGLARPAVSDGIERLAMRDGTERPAVHDGDPPGSVS